ncbi:Phosphoglycerate dehydrogenase [Microlunatus soli]|uniref:Phosphoglycerate dehydrogenase n=2 Tax=Microlunatus soli TaxID=630515 RepID=A0A1H1XTA7_9ACTN|nr:Phosphoglycerate dehydrogenase [Microlunatus soli]
MAPTIETVLCTLGYDEADLDQLRAAFAPAEFVHCRPDDDARITATLERAEVALLAGDLDDRHLAAPRIGWIHCDHAGLNKSARPAIFERGIALTGSAGRSGPALAQHAFHFALALSYDTSAALRQQAGHRWAPPESIRERGCLWGKTLGIIGFGHTGRQMAALGRAFGMRVIVYRRSDSEAPEDVDRMLSADRGDPLDPLLEESDVIMLAVGLSDETHQLIGKRELGLLKADALLINLARGGVVDQQALIEALRDGRIGGAGLDVTDPEPLPEHSELWDLPNVMITPHHTLPMPDKTQRSIDVMIANREHYLRGEPMINAATPRDRYTVG